MPSHVVLSWVEIFAALSLAVFCFYMYRYFKYLLDSSETFEPIAARLENTLDAAYLDKQPTIEDVQKVLTTYRIPVVVYHIQRKAARHEVSTHRLASLLNLARKKQAQYQWMVRNRQLTLHTKLGDVMFPAKAA